MCCWKSNFAENLNFKFCFGDLTVHVFEIFLKKNSTIFFMLEIHSISCTCKTFVWIFRFVIFKRIFRKKKKNL